MRKFGVTCWLDEALVIADQHRDAILCSLKDLVMLDKFLLATPKTNGCIEQLQAYLAQQRMEARTTASNRRAAALPPAAAESSAPIGRCCVRW